MKKLIAKYEDIILISSIIFFVVSSVTLISVILKVDSFFAQIFGGAISTCVLFILGYTLKNKRKFLYWITVFWFAFLLLISLNQFYRKGLNETTLENVYIKKMFSEGSWWNNENQLEIGFYDDYKGRFVDGSCKNSTEGKFIFKDFEYIIDSKNYLVITTDYGLSCNFQLNKNLSDSIITIHYKGNKYKLNKE